MGAYIHRADHPELLVDVLCDLIAQPLDDPFATEIIAVPTRGIDRWLTQRIASAFAERDLGDGVAANIEFPSPHRVVRDVLDQIAETAASVAAWSDVAVVAHLEQIIDDHRGDDWMWLITRFVDGPDGERSGAQRLRAARRIEKLLSTYGRYRPGMIQAWTTGEDVGPAGEPIPESASWQPKMWRLLRDQIGVPPLHEILPGILDRLRSGQVTVDLPDRLSVYGLTAIDPVDLAVLQALGGATDVHFFVLHPSEKLWSSVAQLDAGPAASSRLVRRDDDATVEAAVHPLLRSWGQESRELQLVLTTAGLAAGEARTVSATDSGTLLATLQSDIRANPTPTRWASGADRSIQIHGCHGPQRQVEVLRDTILHLLASDETLEPRDVVIMTPDIETYAPLIEAAFPSAAGNGIPDLRVRIADRSPTSGNPLVRFASQVVDVARSRLGASAVAHLVTLPEVQRHFRISVDQAGEIADLVNESNVRWGLDGDHREREGAGPRDEHTWRRGLDRMLGGVFYNDDPERVVADVAPLDRVEGQAAEAAGKAALLIERLRNIVEVFNSPAPVSEWAVRIGAATRLLAQPPWREEWQVSNLDRLLARTFPPDPADGPDPVIGIDEVAVLVGPWDKDGPGRLHHRTGDITVCTLVPMRSIPYRVVCLVGMEHDRFPRSPRSDGDDLLIDHEVIGDRNRAAEDRQLLLDALMAAGDHFVVIYTGRSPLTNAEQPLAVPIAELYETVESMVGEEAAGEIRTDHPLQPFSPTTFTPGALGVAGSWGHDPVQYAGALALSEREPGQIGDVGPPLPPIEEEKQPLTLDRLLKFLKDPPEAFLRQSLGMFIPDLQDAPDDELPLGLNALEQWSITARFLDGIGRRNDEDKLVARERGLDSVPAGELATESLEASLDLAHRLDRVATERGWDPGVVMPVAGAVTVDGEEVAGSVIGDRDEATVWDVSPSRAKPSRWLSLYAQVAFLSALEPDRAWKGLLVGKKGKEGDVAVVAIGPLGDAPEERSAEGVRCLGELMALYREGTQTPIPLFPETSFAWQAAHPGKRRSPAGKKWVGYQRGGVPGERDAPAAELLFPDLIDIDDLITTDFPDYAERLWAPIQAVSTEETVKPVGDTA